MMRPFRTSAPRSDTTSTPPDPHESDSLITELLSLGGPITDDRAGDVGGKSPDQGTTAGGGAVLDRDDGDVDGDVDGDGDVEAEVGPADDVDPWTSLRTYGSGGDRPPRRLTRLLVAALLFVLGALGGVWVDRAFAPEPQPRVVYLLDG